MCIRTVQARVLMRPGDASIWSSLFEEVSRAVREVCRDLVALLQEGDLDAAEAVEAIWTIVQLKVEGGCVAEYITMLYELTFM